MDSNFLFAIFESNFYASKTYSIIMNKIEIRRATLSDLESIQKIASQTFIETFSAVVGQ